MFAQRVGWPRGFAGDLRRENPSLVLEIVREIRGQIPEYDRPMDSLFISGLMLGVQTALAEFADTVEGQGAPAAQRAWVYRRLGRSELAEGRSMDALQSACRLGGRLAWRRYARVARRVGMRPEQMVDLAEAVFTLVAMERGLVPGTLNSRDPDPACGPQIVFDNVKRDVRVALSNSFGFGGNNCCLAFIAGDRA